MEATSPHPLFQFHMVSLLMYSVFSYIDAYLQGKVSVNRGAALKHILRSMHRMMQSSGTTEGLRGLLDSSLLQSAKKIMENRGVFGPNALAIGNLLAI